MDITYSPAVRPPLEKKHRRVLASFSDHSALMARRFREKFTSDCFYVFEAVVVISLCTTTPLCGRLVSDSSHTGHSGTKQQVQPDKEREKVFFGEAVNGRQSRLFYDSLLFSRQVRLPSYQS